MFELQELDCGPCELGSAELVEPLSSKTRKKKKKRMQQKAAAAMVWAKAVKSK